MAATEEINHQWAMELLMKDEWFSRMAVEDHRRIIGEAIKFGTHLAENTCEKLGVPSGAESICQMLASLGCVVRIDEKSGLPGPMSLYEEDLSAALFFMRILR